jgi:hypothetical protein
LGSHFSLLPSSALHKESYDDYIDNIIDSLIYFSEIAANEGHDILMLEQLLDDIGAFTAEELREILDHGLEYYIQVVLVMQSPDHMTYALKHPESKDASVWYAKNEKSHQT